MLAVATLALLLTPDLPAVPATLPVGRSLNQLAAPAGQTPNANVRRLAVDVSAGWSVTEQRDPYGRAGVSAFNVSAPLVGAGLHGRTWYADFLAQMAHTSLTNRNVTAAVGRDLFGSDRVRLGLSAEFADVRFRREDFRTGDVTIGTNRTATIGLVGPTLSVGPYRGASFRLSALAGYYRNRYGSVVELPGFSGVEPLSDDELNVYGGKLTVQGVTVGDRLEFGGSVRYLQLIGGHAASLPDREYSGTASLNIRLFGVRKKQLFVGAFARFGPARPSLIVDKTFGLRGIWKLR